MKYIAGAALAAASLSIQVSAYLATEENAFNVRLFHVVARDEDGDIGEATWFVCYLLMLISFVPVGRAFSNTYDIVERDEDSLGTFELISQNSSPNDHQRFAVEDARQSTHAVLREVVQ